MSPTASAAAVLDPARLSLHLPRLTKVAARICGSRDAAEDLVQDTLERVLRSPRRLAGDEFPYLVSAMRNTHIDRLRTARRRPQCVALPETFDAMHSVADRAPEILEARAVLAAVADLPADQRDVVVAVDVNGAGYAEAAEALGIPIGTVMSRLYRGRQRVVRAVDPG